MGTDAMVHSERSGPRPAAWWALGVTGATIGLLVYAGVATGNWQGVVVTGAQVMVVGAVCYLGLR